MLLSQIGLSDGCWWIRLFFSEGVVVPIVMLLRPNVEQPMITTAIAIPQSIATQTISPGPFIGSIRLWR